MADQDDDLEDDAAETTIIGNDADTDGSANIYFLSLKDPRNPSHDFDLVKVGFTKGDPEKRIEQLQTGNPFEICCEGHFRSPAARYVEHFVHRTNATRGYQLEWLNVRRSEIQELINAAQRESDVFADVVRAIAQCRRVESKKPSRLASARENKLHQEALLIVPQCRLAKLRLDHLRLRIAIAAGRVKHVAGLVRIDRQDATGRFTKQKAFQLFRELANAHTTLRVGGSFRWHGVPRERSEQRAHLNAECVTLTEQRDELNREMLGSWTSVRDEGERTPELLALHDQYLRQLEQQARLLREALYLRAQVIQGLEDYEGISGVCKYVRKPRPDFDSQSFRQQLNTDQATQCRSEIKERIRRRVYRCRAYETRLRATTYAGWVE